jgi:hypothetical protein
VNGFRCGFARQGGGLLAEEEADGGACEGGEDCDAGAEACACCELELEEFFELAAFVVDGAPGFVLGWFGAGSEFDQAAGGARFGGL